MQHPSSHRSQKENSTVEPKPGDLVNVLFAQLSHTIFGYIVKVEHRFDQFDYAVYLPLYDNEYLFRKEQLEVL